MPPKRLSRSTRRSRTVSASRRPRPSPEVAGYVGATAAGGVPALLGVAGLQGYGDTYDQAKQAGADEGTAHTAAMLTGMADAGMMLVPVHKAMDMIPAAVRGDVVKGLIEAGKSGLTMVGFSQLQTLVDNAVARKTFDPNRDILDHVGEDIPEQFIAGAFFPGARTIVGAGARAIAERVAAAVAAVAVAAVVTPPTNVARRRTSQNRPLHPVRVTSSTTMRATAPIKTASSSSALTAIQVGIQRDAQGNNSFVPDTMVRGITSPEDAAPQKPEADGADRAKGIIDYAEKNLGTMTGPSQKDTPPVVTRGMRQSLAKLGYSPDDIRGLTPDAVQ